MNNNKGSNERGFTIYVVNGEVMGMKPEPLTPEKFSELVNEFVYREYNKQSDPKNILKVTLTAASLNKFHTLKGTVTSDEGADAILARYCVAAGAIEHLLGIPEEFLREYALGGLTFPNKDEANRMIDECMRDERERNK